MTLPGEGRMTWEVVLCTSAAPLSVWGSPGEVTKVDVLWYPDVFMAFVDGH